MSILMGWCMGVIGGWALWCVMTADQGSCWWGILLEPASPMENGHPNHPVYVSRGLVGFKQKNVDKFRIPTL